MIIYTEKGFKLHELINEAGYRLIDNTNDEAFDADGNQSTAIDTAVQAIIDAYDPVPEAKTNAIARIKVEAASRVHAIYPFVDSESADVIGFYNYSVDMWTGGALTGRLLQLKSVRDDAVAAIATVDAMTDWQVADAYDATNW